MKKKKNKLTFIERMELARIRKHRMRLVRAGYRPSQAIQGLLKKGLIKELPGVLENSPQGYVAI